MEKRRKLTQNPTEPIEGPSDAVAAAPSSSSVKFDFFNAHFCVGIPEHELQQFSTENGNDGHGRPRPPATAVERMEFEDAELSSQYTCSLINILPRLDLDHQISPDDCIPFKRILHHFHRLRAAQTPSNGVVGSIDQALYQYIGRYMDLCCASTGDTDFKPLFCLHALSHVMRTRNLVISNKQRLEKAREQCRDQGLARPKVLILAPMRKFAYAIVKTMVALMFGEDRPFVQRLARFESEFGDTEGNQIHEKRAVAQDYRELMNGNVDDCFRLGIGLAKKCLKLYTPFNESDFILCSPLGLKMLLDETAPEGDETSKNSAPKKQKRQKASAPFLRLGTEKRRRTDGATNDDDDGGPNDFLASIELLIVERADILLMQNWEHVQSVFALLNSVPCRVRTDITRVRRWALSGDGTHARHYRQTLLFTRTHAVEMHALFAQHCANFAGLATVVQKPTDPPLITQLSMPYVQEFHRFDAASPAEQAEQRFQYFVRQIFPKCQSGTLLFVPSYFDFVRVRNWLKRQCEHFVQLHEYAQTGKVAKARNLFARGERRMMLMTERFHYYFRYPIKGVNAIMFYQAPQNAHFYNELMQMGARNLQKSASDHHRLPCWLLFSKFDCLRLQNIFGTEATQILLDQKQSENPQILEAN
ncbi:hypothetical protein niasHT_035794 [Heterodera trifolii]|uniref:Digestive organ expansion factor n=1 Tax=Heterodera trifolii TaxID=157864 RepID=A0ABD2IZZ5_9BILA